MLEPPNNLLDEAPLRAEIVGKIVPLSLPGLLAALSADQVNQLPGLQAHQEHACFAFLVQVAAMAMFRAGLSALPTDTATWRAPLLALTDGDLGAWSLVRDDLCRPAFLQPPVPDGSITGWKNVLPTPDSLDLLVTAKNHDVKGQRIGAAQPEHWIYALVSLQTMEGFSGRGNYGILRMNSGFGNRPYVARTSGLRFGARFRDDVQALLETRAKVLELGFQADGGLAFAALPPWDGKVSLSLNALDPYFIECCRRVRLTRGARGVEARMAPSECPRVKAPAELLSSGDPWTPVNKADGKPLTASAKGFHYSVVHKLLLSGEFAPPPSMAEGTNKHLFMAQALVRGQGKTEGFHERVVPIPPEIVWQLFEGEASFRERVGELSAQQIKDVDLVRLSVLRPALRMLLDGGESRGLRQDSRPDRWVTAFDQAVDARFFEVLWQRAQNDTDESTRAWLQTLKQLARDQLELAIRGAPIPLTRRYKAVAIAERVFEGSFRKKFALQLKEPDHVQP